MARIVDRLGSVPGGEEKAIEHGHWTFVEKGRRARLPTTTPIYNLVDGT